MHRYILLLVLVVAVFIQESTCQLQRKRKCEKRSLTTVSGTRAKRFVCPGQLIFEDNFDKLDFKLWHHDNTLSGGGNWEFQWYTNNRSNSFVKDGRLVIKPTLTAEVVGEENLYSMTMDINGFMPADYCTDLRWEGCSRTGTKNHIVNPIRSAKLSTIHSFSFRYGKMQIRARMPTGDWLWPAIWLLPRYNAYGPWPGSGTIVVAQARGNENLILDGVNIGTEQVEARMHWGPDVTHDGFAKTRFIENRPGKGFNKEFSLYELEWTPDHLKFSIDGKEFGFVDPKTSFWSLGNFTEKDNPWVYGSKMAPFDDEFFLIINLAVGGVHYFPDEAKNAIPKPWSNKASKAATDFWQGRDRWLPTWNKDESAGFQIDFVKIWAL